MRSFNISRRNLIGAGASLFGAMHFPLIAQAAEESPLEVKTTLGMLRGKAEGGVAKFLGVPYAKPPLENLRFKAPQPLEAWSGVRDAIAFGNPSIQGPNPEMGPDGNGRMPAPSEDCLYLNVWTPAADNKRRPVMFYSHGGGYMIGSGASGWQDGTNLAKKHDVVVVQSNHRLGALGYLFLADIAKSDEFAANQGMLDILAALRWTRENIEAFGGDPDRIMIFGESGGGAKTTALYTMPDAAPNYRCASVESSARLKFTTRDGATERARVFLNTLGVGENDLAKLYDIPAEEILKAQMADMPMGSAPWEESSDVTVPGLGAFVDGTIIPQNPFADGAPPFSADKPLMCGTTRDEMVFFSLFGPPDIFTVGWDGLPDALVSSNRIKPELVEPAISTFRKSRPDASAAEIYFAITTSTITRDSIRMAEIKVKQNAAPAYRYELAYHSPVKVKGTEFEMGSPHASDILMKFDNPEMDFMFGADQSEARHQTAHNMSALWAGFARYGKPIADGLPEWTAYNLEDRPTMRIDAECRVVNDLDRQERLFWENAG